MISRRWKLVCACLLGMAFGLALLGATVLDVKSQPPIFVPYGFVYIEGQPAEYGTPVEARIGGAVVSQTSTYTTTDGKKGRYIMQIEGIVGDQVRFFVLGAEADESPQEWRSGTYPLDLHIRQAHLRADIAAPSRVNVGTTFTVSAAISNTGHGDATTATAVLSATAGAELAEGEVARQTLGDITAGHAATVTWSLVCTETGDVTVTVTPAGVDGNSGEAIPSANLEADSVVIHQELRAHLVADVVAPGEVSTGQQFQVIATVENTGDAHAENITVTVEITGSAELAPGEAVVKSAEPLGSGSVALPINWIVLCTGPGDAIVTVIPAGIDRNTGEAIPDDGLVSESALVHQTPATVHLPLIVRNWAP